MAIESSTTSSISPWWYKTQGSVWSSKWTVVWKSAGSPFPGTYKQCAKCASKSRLCSYRVGYGYRVYYFIYFPVVVQNTGKRVVLQVDGSVEVCRVTISRYL